MIHGDWGEKVIDLSQSGIKFVVEGVNVTYIDGVLVASAAGADEEVLFSFDPLIDRCS